MTVRTSLVGTISSFCGGTSMSKTLCGLRPTKFVLLIGAALLLESCTSTSTLVYREPTGEYEKLGPATGSATGSLGILGTAYYFIPMYLNSRVERAYEEALASVPGATGLINVEVKEDWYWWVIGTARTTTISGDAIKEVNK